MKKYYTDEKNAQIIVTLLKEHGIRKIVASPGTTNMALVGSLQNDPFFEMYSSVDERSAAYLACGLSSESGEPVVLSCTGATASRNYLPGLTEAFYRKLPVLAITSTQSISKVGHNIAQVIDRSSMPKDAAKISITLPIVKDEKDFWECEVKVNMSILELSRNGGGPVHINLPTTYSRNFSIKELPNIKKINRVKNSYEFPELPIGKIAIFIGAHSQMTLKQTENIDKFCEMNNAVVFCDHTSGYQGKYRLLYSLAASQENFDSSLCKPDLLIHIGEITGDYSFFKISGKEVWRVSEDGELKDTFGKLHYIFQTEEDYFFNFYSKDRNNTSLNYFNTCKDQLTELYDKIPTLPFSNNWIASRLANIIPDNSVIHFGILNSLRSWNFFDLPKTVKSMSNVGGFGIDGIISTLVGASLVDKTKLYFGITGDLSFFYDMNVLGNRHVGNNLRILMVNNGKGVEFRNFNHPGSKFGDDADQFMAAAGHFGNKSSNLVKDYAENLGFEYLSALNKNEFEIVEQKFLNKNITPKPIFFEVFTDAEDESEALKLMININKSVSNKSINITKEAIKKTLGEKGISTLKKIVGK